MTKKTYLRPTTNVVEVKSAQLVCASAPLSGVNSTGLDENETLDYGNGDTKKMDVWESAW